MLTARASSTMELAQADADLSLTPPVAGAGRLPPLHSPLAASMSYTRSSPCRGGKVRGALVTCRLQLRLKSLSVANTAGDTEEGGVDEKSHMCGVVRADSQIVSRLPTCAPPRRVH